MRKNWADLTLFRKAEFLLDEVKLAFKKIDDLTERVKKLEEK